MTTYKMIGPTLLVASLTVGGPGCADEFNAAGETDGDSTGEGETGDSTQTTSTTGQGPATDASSSSGGTQESETDVGTTGGAEESSSDSGGPCADDDDDGVCNNADQCEGFDDGLDRDEDGVADGCDVCAGDDEAGDDDRDGICDDQDFCAGDDAAGDSDRDGVCDDVDLCDGDDATGDADGDGVCSDLDNCLPVANADQADAFAPLGVGDACSVVFVDTDALPGGNGSSWDEALTTVDAAVVAATEDFAVGGILKQIWIAEGTYRPVEAGAPVLVMLFELQVYGGFAGDESRIEDRPAPLLTTALSGDFAADDSPLDPVVVEDNRNDPNDPDRVDNTAGVVVMAESSVLDGVTVRDGYAAVATDGIGVRVPEGVISAVLRDVSVLDNVGAVVNASGAGVSVFEGASVTLESVLIEGNIGWNGAGLEMLPNANVTIRDSVFRGNAGIGGQGAGIRNRGGNLTVDDTQFIANRMQNNAGVAYQQFAGGSTQMTNVLFERNSGRFPALSVGLGNHTFVNMTAAGNLGGTQGTVRGSASITHSVFFGNGPVLASDEGDHPASITFSCSDQDVSALGGDNILLDDSAPALADPFSVGPQDELFLNHLASGDSVTSACVDAGDTTDPDALFPGFSTTTTRTDGVLDGASGDAIDLGFHYDPA